MLYKSGEINSSFFLQLVLKNYEYLVTPVSIRLSLMKLLKI